MFNFLSTRRNTIKVILALIVFSSFLIIPRLAGAYQHPVWCFQASDCNTGGRTLYCDDDRPGYQVSCRYTGDFCGPDTSYGGVHIEKCGYTRISCECYGVGWHDYPYWGGCSDCTSNSTNNCTPCGEAMAYCDGCNWNTDWYPFRDEYYTGTGPGHKCPGTTCPICDCSGYSPGWYDAPFWGGCDDCATNPLDPNNNCPPCGPAYAYCDGCNWDTSTWKCAGSPKTCTPNSKVCSGTVLLTCSGDGCSRSSTDCGSPYWTDSYTCSGGRLYRLYILRGCSGSSCYSQPEWVYLDNCISDYWSDNYRCSDNWRQRELMIGYCDADAGSCRHREEWINWSDCGSPYWTNEYRCSGDMVQRKYANRGCSGGSCYSNDIWYDWEYCNNYDNCYVYSSGCEDRNYYCSSGACTYSVSNRHTDYYDNYVNYCADAINLRTHRLLHDYYCTGVTCADHQSWQNDSFVENCNGRDACVGTTWRDWYCSGTACAYTDYPGHSNCNQAPSIPIRNSPSDNWQNTNPTFTVTSTDPNGNNYRAYFNILGYGDNWSGWTNSGQPASWGSLNLGNCFNNWWRAYSQDTFSFNSAWSGYWQVKVDKDNPPNPTISYPTGTYVISLTFTVSLTESDTCSGINSGDVDIRIKPKGPGWGNWQDYTSTINDFSYTGIDGYSYQFRYRVMDNAGNWSNFAEGGEITIALNKPPTTINLNTSASDPCDLPPFYSFKFTYTDPEANTESRFDFQADNNSNFLSPEIDRTFSNLSYPSPTEHTQTISLATTPMSGYLAYNTIYYWRARTYDQYGLASNWTTGPQISTFVYKSPSCDFTLVPQNPVPLEAVAFSDNSRCWDEDPVNGSDCSSSKGDTFSWDFDVDNKGGADPETSTNENQTVKFSNPGSYKVKLIVTDRGGHSCSTTKTIKTSLPLPKWKEIRPW